MTVSVADLLAEARARGIRLSEDAGRLRYEAPKNALTPELKRALRDNKEEILRFLQDARASVGARPVAIEPVSRDAPLPASFAQTRLWFMHQLAPESPFYNVPAAPRVRGTLHVDALRRSLSALVERHEALRTTFFFSGGELFQRVGPAEPLDLEIADVASFPPGEKEDEARRLQNEACRLPFDLERGPLVRALLVRLDTEDHILALTLHHIVSDGWSMEVLVRDLFSLYRGETLAPLTIQYADYASWQRERLTGDVLAEHLAFWTKELEGLEPIGLTTDYARPARPTYRGERLALTVPEAVSSSLRDFSSRHGVSLFTTLLTAFQALLYRYTGQRDVAVGCPMAGRDVRELEELIGFFVNSLVMRTEVDPGESFSELLLRVSRTTGDAFAHQELPFEKLVEEVAPERDKTQNPLFQIVFALQAKPMVPDADVTWAWADTGATRFDLEAHVFDGGGSLELVFVYATDLFARASIERLERHFLTFLEAAVAEPDTSIRALPIATREERQQTLALGFPKAAPRAAGTLDARLEEQARATPDRIAVRFGDEELTYRALDRRANAMAHRLVEAGVAPETPVALLAERHPSTLVAMIAILKAGGVYVPLDASYPESRIEHMIEEVGAPIVLGRTHPLPIDDGWELERDTPPRRKDGTPNEEGLAYVMFTSGSTGAPKGSAIPHRGVLRLVRDPHYVTLGSEDVVLQLAPLSFDASTFEIWGALLNGATLALFPGARPFPEEVAAAILRYGVTTLWLTATLFNEMVDREAEALARVRQVLAGGEALSRTHVRRALDAQARADGAVIVNGYGPTENTTFTCCHVMAADTTLPRTVPIGRPIGGTFVRLLDASGDSVPVGVPGELCAGGDGLARGYWARPELTAERFIPDPFATESSPGARLYRTGDLCRWLDDGTIEFLGRDDTQVKLRGFRIELDEIDAALAELPGVAEAAAVLREDEPGDKKLVAYVVPDAKPNTTHEAGASHVFDWQTLFDRIYVKASSHPERDFTGWNSSYTGEPIPEIEMVEWLDRTVERILSRQPRRILEIGCGTGLLLHRLAPVAERYVATDFSEPVLERLRKQDLHGAILLKREARDFEGLENESFDTVILNSITQYFPGTEYLLRVLQGAARLLVPGGRIFLGDVRNLDLLEPFHASVEHALAPPGTPPEAIGERVAHALEQEAELLVSPDFFRAAAASIPRASGVEILVKRGRFANELNRFRYDVFLHVEAPAPPTREVATDWIDWGSEGLDEERLATLFEERSAPFGIRNVPDGRLSEPMGLVEPGRTAGVDLERLHETAREYGLDGEASYARTGGRGFVDLLFRPDGDHSATTFPAPRESRARALGNDPLRAKIARALVPKLREEIKGKVPEYMVPHLFVILDALPVDANGKLDVKALPRPRRSRSGIGGDYVAPRSRSEKTLARIWAEILRVDRVGALDNFFELGGDSILGIQVITRAREEGLSIRAADIFESQTVRELAEAVDAAASLLTPAPAPDPAVEEAGGRDEEAPLTPIERWFFSQELADPSHFNQSMLLVLDRSVTTDDVRGAISTIVSHHDVLRSRFHREAKGWKRAAGARGLDIEVFQTVEIENVEELARRAETLQRGLDIEKGLLTRFALFDLGPSEPKRLLIVIHHLVVDAVSWSILLDDLSRLLEGRDLPPKTASFQVWAARAASRPTPLEGLPPSNRLPRDREGENDGESVRTLRVYLQEEEVAPLLSEDAESGLLRALAEAFAPWTGSNLLPVTLERHGRDADPTLDLSRTVGWFTTLNPVLVEATASEGSPAPADVRPEVSFSYFGRMAARPGGRFRRSDESTGAAQSPRNRRFHLIDVTARIESESRRLRIDWHYSEAIHARETIDALSRRFVEALRETEARRSKPEYALAPMQRGILFHTLYEDGGDAVYVQQYGIVLDDLEPASFRRAWQQVVDRHPVLRTCIIGPERKTPLQRVEPEATLEIVERDLRPLADDAETKQSQRIQGFLEEDRRRGIDLGAAPLMRLALLRLDERRYECIWTFHHIVLDGWSVPLVLEEVFLFYDAYRRGERLSPHPAPPLPRPYRDYILWLERQDATGAERFWRDRLQNLSGRTPLEGFRGSGSRTRRREDYGETKLELTPEATERLRGLAARHHVTLNTVVLGAWALLLSRYSGEDDIVFGTTVSGRPPELEGVESMIGLFINTLPTRVILPADGPLGSWLSELQRHQVQQREFQYAPLWEIQRWAGLPKGSSLFDSLFVFENYPLVGASLPKDLRLRSRPSIERSGYPLAVAVSARENLSVRLYYRTQDFEVSMVEQIAAHLRNIVDAMTASPEPSLAAISPLTSKERYALLIAHNRTDAPYPADRAVHELIEAQARERPEALAVAASGSRLSFAELNARANRLARRLTRFGMQSEEKAGVCLHRGVDLVVAELAIMKAGGAFVPLAPEYPRPRLELILEDAGIRVLITTEGLASRLPAFRGEVVHLDDESVQDGDVSSAGSDPELPVSPDALAYVVYTSGSTGRPKGVEVTHRSLLNLVHWHRDAYDVRPGDRATQIASIGFDACVWELWPNLTAGASVIIPDDETRSSPLLLLEWLAREAITLCFLPTPLAEAALEETLPEGLALRALLTGGDRLSRGLTRELPFAFVNHYGLTETAVVATSGRVDRSSPPPIGRPVANTTCYVLNGRLEPVPTGVPGELFIGGAGIARGYVSKPALTAERFLADPFSKDPGARLYRTGDVARLLSDGAIEFLGRNDEQVKIRGHRVEIAEIELALTEHPSVRESIVICREDESGGRRLTAYVVTEPRGKGNVLSPQVLRDFLEARLPHFMVPAAFVLLDAMPLNENGKVDRASLPAPTAARPNAPGPRTDVERALSAIWSEVLGAAEAGPEDNFFELGGDSITSIRVVARARDVGLDLSAKHLFEHPTLGELAESLGHAAPRRRRTDGSREPSHGPVPLSPLASWFFEQEFPEPHHFNQAVLLALRAPVEPHRWTEAVRTLVARHDALRLRFHREAEDTEWQQTVAPDTGRRGLPLVHVDLSALSGAEAASAASRAKADIQRSLDLTEGPVFRLALLETGASSPMKMLWVIHHLAVDAVSWSTLLSELEETLKGHPLPPATASYAEWARVSGPASRSPEYSGASLSDVDVPRELPRDRDGVNDVASADTVSVSLESEDCRALTRELPGAWGMELPDVFLTALTDAFSDFVGERRLLVTFEGHGRDVPGEDLDLSGTVGWFTALYPVLVDLRGARDAATALQRAREQRARAFSEGRSAFVASNRLRPEVSFNYVGRMGSSPRQSALFASLQEPLGPTRSPRSERLHAIEVVGRLADERMRFDFVFSPNLHHRATIETLAHAFVEALRSLIRHGRSAARASVKPSDFELAELNQKQIDALMKRRKP